jgi:hypothetical protein
MGIKCLFRPHSTKVIDKFESVPYREYVPNEFSAYLDGHFEVRKDITYVMKCSKCGKIIKGIVTVTLEVL